MTEHALQACVELRAWRDHEGSAAFVEVLEPEEVDAFHGSRSRPLELLLRTLIEPISHNVCYAGRAGNLASEPVETHLLLFPSQHLQLVFLIGIRFEFDRDAWALRTFDFAAAAKCKTGSSGHQRKVEWVLGGNWAYRCTFSLSSSSRSGARDLFLDSVHGPMVQQATLRSRKRC